MVSSYESKNTSDGLTLKLYRGEGRLCSHSISMKRGLPEISLASPSRCDTQVP